MNHNVQLDQPEARQSSGIPIPAEAGPRTPGTVSHPAETDIALCYDEEGIVCPRNANDVERRDQSSLPSSKPTLPASGPSAKGKAINSVKARIKELEEKAKAAGRNTSHD
jgi:hypothetical protein